MPEPANTLLQRVLDSVTGTYELLGELGKDELGLLLYLAREIATGKLVGVSVLQDDDEGTEFTLEVRTTLGETVSVEGSTCPECNTVLPDLERFCFHCGADLSGIVAPEGTPESNRLLAALSAATTGRYDILGRMDRAARAGTVYFARDLASRRIVALRLRRAEPGDAAQAEYVVRQTAVFRAPSAGAPALSANGIAGSATLAGGAASVGVPTGGAATRGEATSGAASSGAATGGAAVHGADDGWQTVVGAVGSPDSASRGKPAWLRAPVIASAAAVLIAVVGYFAFSGAEDSGAPASPVAAAPASIAPAPAPLPAPAPDSAAMTPTPGSVAAPPPLAPSADSGTVRIVTVLPPGARVTVNGRTVRGRSVRLPLGSHTFAVAASGYESFSQRVTLREGADVQWAPRLVETLASGTTPVAPTPETDKRGTATCRSSVRGEEWAAAFTLCTAEANAGDIPAASSLARLYARGLGTRRNVAEAFTWYAKAAQGGDRDAQTALGYALRDGLEVRRDPPQSVRWFKQAAEAGDRSAQLEYAVALEKGDGIRRDEPGAREWYRKSADQGNFMASRRLARMLERGAGGARSDVDAAAAFERAATLGDSESALVIAKWYRDGRGVAKSAAQALVWFKKAAELGNREADAEIRRLEKGG